MQTETPQREQKVVLRWQRFVFSPFVATRNTIVGLIVLTPLLLRGWFLSRVPYIDEPFDVHQFCRVEIPPGQNAFEHYSPRRDVGGYSQAKQFVDLADFQATW